MQKNQVKRKKIPKLLIIISRARKQKRNINNDLDIDRMRKIKKVKGESMSPSASSIADDKRPRTAFTTEQLNKLRQEFTVRYLFILEA